MTWMFWRKKKIQEAQDALKSAKEAGKEVNNVSGRLERKKTQNNFAPLLKEAFGGRGSGGK